MPDPRFAEWILKLVTAPDRAAAAVGDLIEESERRGRAWFWWNVLATAASHVWQELRDRPVSMLLLALSGVAEFGVLGAVIANLVIKVWMEIAPFPYAANAIYIPPWGYRGLLIFLGTALPLFVGWEVARRSRGREVAAGVALIAISMLIAVVVTWNGRDAGVRLEGGPYPNVEYRLGGYSMACFAMAGALWRRIAVLRRKWPRSLVA